MTTNIDHSFCPHHKRSTIRPEEIDDAIAWQERCRPGGAYVSMQEAVDKACEQRLYREVAWLLAKKRKLGQEPLELRVLQQQLQQLQHVLRSAVAGAGTA